MVQETGAAGATQHIPGSYRAEEIARTLAATGLAWCWLDGEASAPGEEPTSYFGLTEDVFECHAGDESEFLEHLRPPDGATGGSAENAAASDRGFRSGWVAALSYEFGVALMGLTPAQDDASPAFALRLTAVLALTDGSLELRSDTPQALAAWVRAYGAVFEEVTAAPESSAHSVPTRPAWRRAGSAYAAQVAECQRSIAAGDAYVMCLTDIATCEGQFDPIEIYVRLRRSGTATRGGVICAGDRALVSASPERFLTVRGRQLSTHPIKGTRPRDHDPRRDAGFAAELAADPKERAENLMIVDLMRNDLSRVCDAGSVVVSEFLRVEQHPHVHQLVSTVQGTLSEGNRVADAIAACFPGGSMTGAPKRRAVELLAGLESGPRGLYSGCFGWLDDAGDAELAMTIRGIELRGLKAPLQRALIGAGGGVTADSDPESERAEKDLKAASLFAAIA